jgi:hypothetical protein
MRSINILNALALVIGISLIACTTPAYSDANCAEWLAKANTNAEAVPISQRYHKILEELAKGCQALPANLSEAARNCLNEKNADIKKTLITAAGCYFSNACIPENPGIPASKLLHICKKGDFPEGEFNSMLENIDAATYLYGKALKKEFEKSNIYEPNGKRLLSNFFLSNAVLRESMGEKDLQ